jgi:hypothetical protein
VSKAKPWNWCHKCNRVVPFDDNHVDGSVVKCWKCKRRFVITWGTRWNLLPLESKFQGEAKARARARRQNERKS